ncbi:MAG: hypothetical protein E7638_06555 [Ruminococcaceae bacterium]|nr:hypothetical protein [Oscillospiraceae bacterium]
MRKILLIIASLVCASVLAVGTAAVDAAAETVEADLTLLSKGELAAVHFDPAFEENLSESEYIVYKALEDGIATLTECIDISAAGYTDTEALTAFLDTVFNTELLWNPVEDKVVYTVTDGTVTEIGFSYSMPDGPLTAYAGDYSPTKAEIDHALADISTGMSAVEKALILHDYLVREVDYNLGVVTGGSYSPNVFTMEGVFVDRNAVCQGYALAYSFLLKEVGIESMIVVSAPMNHAWNMVKINNKWYHVDVTWDDPTNKVEVDFCRGGFVRHTYFLRSDAEFLGELEDRHYDWVNFDNGTAAPSASESDAFVGYCFRPTEDADVAMLNYYNGYYYCLSNIFGSNTMYRSKVSGLGGVEITLPRVYDYLFFFNGYLYGSTSSYVYEINMDGTDNRIVAAASGTIRNFWLKQDELAYYEVDDSGKAVKKVVDLTKAPDNLVIVGDFSFVIDEKGNATLSSYTGSASVVNIPSTAGGHPVVAVGDQVFLKNSTMTKVVIPEGVTSIGYRAFLQSTVAEVVLPDSLVTIGDEAFWNCNYIKNITIPRAVKTMGKQAFYACFQLSKVFFEGSVPKVWGSDMFGRMENSITLYYLSGRNGWKSGTWTDPTGVSYKASAYGTIPLDVNGDGDENLIDAALLKMWFLQPAKYPLPDIGYDFNLDGVTNAVDATVLMWRIIEMN